jgi:hypothetical protein
MLQAGPEALAGIGGGRSAGVSAAAVVAHMGACQAYTRRSHYRTGLSIDAVCHTPQAAAPLPHTLRSACWQQ